MRKAIFAAVLAATLAAGGPGWAASTSNPGCSQEETARPRSRVKVVERERCASKEEVEATTMLAEGLARAMVSFNRTLEGIEVHLR